MGRQIMEELLAKLASLQGRLPDADDTRIDNSVNATMHACEPLWKGPQ